MFTPDTPNVKRKIKRTFSKSRPKFGKFWRLWQSMGQGVQKVSNFTAKGTPLRESTSFQALCIKIGWGV